MLTNLSQEREFLGCLRRNNFVTVLLKQKSDTVTGDFLGRLVLGVEGDEIKVFGATIFWLKIIKITLAKTFNLCYEKKMLEAIKNIHQQLNRRALKTLLYTFLAICWLVILVGTFIFIN